MGGRLCLLVRLGAVLLLLRCPLHLLLLLLLLLLPRALLTPHLPAHTREKDALLLRARRPHLRALVDRMQPARVLSGKRKEL